MLTVKQVSEETGVSIRTLRYYDRIGLLRPDGVTDAGYRLYGDNALLRLNHILLCRELGFTLKQIAELLDAPEALRNAMLETQIAQLEQKREHLSGLITFARGVKLMGVENMDHAKHDANTLEKQAKQLYGKTAAYKEYEQKSKNRSKQDENSLADGLMQIFSVFGTMREGDPACAEAQQQVKALQEYITQHYYTCTRTILAGLGRMYSGGGSMTDNIDAAGGRGTAEFTAKAIAFYTKEEGCADGTEHPAH